MRISKNPVLEISNSLSMFRKAVDEIVEDFDRQGAIDHASILKHKGEWTTEYMQKCLNEAKMKNLNRLRPRYQQARKKVTDDCGFHLSVLKRRFDQHFISGCRPEYVTKIEAYKTMSVIPSKREIQLLADDASSYSEKQILKAFLLDLGKSQVQTDDQGNLDRSKQPLIDLTDYERYGLDTVNIDDAYKILDAFRDSVELMIEHYCQQNKDIYPLTGHVSEKDAGNGVTVASDDFIFRATNATSYFDNKADREIRDQIDRLNGIMERKSELTASEKDLLHSLLAPIPSRDLPEAIQTICNADARLASLIEVSSEYRKYIDI